MAALLGGCVLPPPPPTEAAARARIVGMVPGQVAACMGLPETQLREGNVVSWSYTTPGGDGLYTSVDPTATSFDYTGLSGGLPSYSFNHALMAPEKAACTVQIIFDGSRVGAVSFHARDNADQCGAIVAPCVY